MTHTATPWKLTYFEIDDVQHLRGAEGQVIATIHSQVTGEENEFEKQEEDRANDALLLAAPEMLRALMLIAEGGKDVSSLYQEIAREAIAKASSVPGSKYFPDADFSSTNEGC